MYLATSSRTRSRTSSRAEIRSGRSGRENSANARPVAVSSRNVTNAIEHPASV
ncbi:hypothetical protein [Nonomuraea dietziae]|uniref:hypothetical protein n=1 Tax=Nonomuraea dietziae TaxID=65515 RepID=UPI0031D1F57E